MLVKSYQTPLQRLPSSSKLAGFSGSHSSFHSFLLLLYVNLANKYIDIGLKDTRAAVFENPDSLMTKMLHWDSTSHSATEVCQADTKAGFALTSALCIGVMSVVITWQK